MKANDPAYPVNKFTEQLMETDGEIETQFYGLTIRQEFVKAAMRGLISENFLYTIGASKLAEKSVEAADACIAEEERTRDK